jgi:hypothetical protein
VREEQLALILRRLQADYPQLAITAEVCGPARIWVARGGDGHHPWLVLSSDLSRFRAALGQPSRVIRDPNPSASRGRLTKP